MNPHAKRAAEIEAAFLAGAEANLDQAQGTRLPGTKWSSTTRSQESRVRELVIASGQDRHVLRSVPKNRSYILTGMRRRWFFGQRRTSVAIATVLSPVEHYVNADEKPPATDLAELVSHVKELVGDADVPYLVGVCSPNGFTENVRKSGLQLPNVTLILIEQRDDGTWDVVATDAQTTEIDRRLFDPEAVTRKLMRVREEIQSRSAELTTGGLTASAIAEKLSLPIRLVTTAFEQAATENRMLKLSRQHDDVLLFRGAAAGTEDDAMSLSDRIRQLFSGQDDDTKKIDALSERRAKLVLRRDAVYHDITQLEQREGELLTQGKDTSSPTTKHRIASQIKQLRDDITRLNTTAKMLGQQVDIISTHIHNLTLLQQGKIAKLPSTEEITEDAVRAEEMLEQLGAEVELTSSLDAKVTETVTSEEELAILKELEAPIAEVGKPVEPEAETSAAETEPEPMKEDRESDRREPEVG